VSNTNSLLELLTHADTAKTPPASSDARTPLAGLEVLIRMIVQEELHRQLRPALVDDDNAGDEHDDASAAPVQARNAARADADEADAHVMSAEAVAAFLGVDRNTVYDYAGRGTIPCRRLGKRLLFHKPALVAWLDPCKAASTRKG
jgi:excisionase family DNA binding protein